MFFNSGKFCFCNILENCTSVFIFFLRESRKLIRFTCLGNFRISKNAYMVLFETMLKIYCEQGNWNTDFLDFVHCPLMGASCYNCS